MKKARAALDSVSVFVDTLLAVHDAKAKLLELDPLAMQVDPVAAEPLSKEPELPSVIGTLIPKILHCCFEDSWQARLAGKYHN